MMNLLKKLDISIKDEYEIEFYYEMLKINESFKPITADVKEILDNSLIQYYELIKNPTWKNFINIYNPDTKVAKEFSSSKCARCPFEKYCLLKLQKGENQVWQK